MTLSSNGITTQLGDEGLSQIHEQVCFLPGNQGSWLHLDFEIAPWTTAHEVLQRRVLLEVFLPQLRQPAQRNCQGYGFLGMEPQMLLHLPWQPALQIKQPVQLTGLAAPFKLLPPPLQKIGDGHRVVHL